LSLIANENKIMKKLITLGAVCLGLLATAQETQEQKNDAGFQRWAVDLGAGFHKPTRPFVSGHTDSPDLFQVDLGARYMITRSFGIGLEVGYNNIQSADDLAAEFSSDYLRVGLEGYVNLGNMVGLKDATSRFGILGHGGIGLGFLAPQEPASYDDTDTHLNFTAGIMPQYRLGKSFAVFADLTIIGTTRNDYAWDGAVLPGDVKGFEGLLINSSLGLTYYFGKGSTPADWASNPLNDRMDALATEMENMAREYSDDDQDGVPNYMDRDNTTESGVRVDNKGRAIDLNKNNIPDDMESAMEARYASKTEVQGMIKENDAAQKGLVKQLINEGYVNVYFKFNSTKPALYSLEAINTIVNYMKNNPGATATLTGYADELGNADYNKTLSERRAKMVHDVLVASGIDASRLTITANGEDASVDKNSSEARQLVRRVTFRVK
jgi:OOP family OmpA-OmpF porin